VELGETVSAIVMIPSYSEGKVSRIETTKLTDSEPRWGLTKETPGIELEKLTLVPPTRS
jgi:hypothetical protein